MSRPLSWIAVLALVSLFGVGCEEPITPPERLLQRPLDAGALDKYDDPMVNNAAASNMSIADGHFHPHTSELNSLGIRQLERLSTALDRFGGTVRYETRSTDEDMIAARVLMAERFLTDTGMVMDNVKVEPGLPSGRGISATQAIIARTKAHQAKSGGGDDGGRSK